MIFFRYYSFRRPLWIPGFGHHLYYKPDGQRLMKKIYTRPIKIRIQIEPQIN